MMKAAIITTGHRTTVKNPIGNFNRKRRFPESLLLELRLPQRLVLPQEQPPCLGSRRTLGKTKPCRPLDRPIYKMPLGCLREAFVVRERSKLQGAGNENPFGQTQNLGRHAAQVQSASSEQANAAS